MSEILARSLLTRGLALERLSDTAVDDVIRLRISGGGIDIFGL